MSDQLIPLESVIRAHMSVLIKASSRLGTVAPCEQLISMIDAYETVRTTIGTLQHEVALDTVKKQLKLARLEVLANVRDIWRDFWATRRHASELLRQQQRFRQKLQERRRRIEELDA